jgi:fluoroacetyl-CoA thioesterase
MKDTLAVGLTMTRRIDIDTERTIDFMGDELRVYATPMMARDIEIACRDLVFEHLDDGEDTVGARIEVDHLGATLLDSWVDITVTIVDIDGRRVTLESDVKDPLDAVGKARHVRFVIDVERQKQRLETKTAKLKEGGG